MSFFGIRLELFSKCPKKSLHNGRLLGKTCHSKNRFPQSIICCIGKRIEIVLVTKTWTFPLTAKAEAAVREQEAMLSKEDLSDMVAEHAARQSSKRKRQAAKEQDSKSAKKYKEFKF